MAFSLKILIYHGNYFVHWNTIIISIFQVMTSRFKTFFKTILNMIQEKMWFESGDNCDCKYQKIRFFSWYNVIKTKIFTEALFTIARTWKQPKCPSTDEWIKKLWNIYTMVYYSAIRRNKFQSVVVRWMNLEPVIQNEVSQKETNIIY